MDPEIVIVAGAEEAPAVAQAETGVASAASEVAQAAAIVASTAANAAPFDPSILTDELRRVFDRLDSIFSKIEKLENDVFVLDGKVDELLTLELEEPEPAAAVVAETPAGETVTAAAGELVAEEIAPDTPAEIVEPTPRRKRAARWI